MTILKSRNRWRRKISHTALRLSKDLRQFARDPINARPDMPRVLMIFGCQRSGTTMMTRIFEKDYDAKVFPEHSVLSNQDKLNGLRLNPLPEVLEVIQSCRYPFVVLKPLVETQNARQVLDYFQGSRALWMYRHYADVANSNLNRFGLGNGIKNLRYIAQRDATNWRSEKVSRPLQELVDSNFSEDMNPYDAAALFWYIRNSYFFELNLDRDERVLMIRYNDLTDLPEEMVSRIYRHAGRSFPGPELVNDVHSKSVGKGQLIKFSPEIEALCDEMLDRLDDVYTGQSAEIHQKTVHS